MLEPGEHLHIGKGRYHAFRKLCARTLPDDDCHSDLRRVMHERLKREQFDFNSALYVSIAWDWCFLGVTVEGMTSEMKTTLEAACKNRLREPPHSSLAIPRLCIISACNTAMAVLKEHDIRHPTISLGIHTS